MNRRRFCVTLGSALGSALGSTAIVPFLAHSPAAASEGAFFERSAKGFGTTVRLVVRHPSQQIAQRAVDQALAELARIESLMSIYRADSQVARLNRDGCLQNPDPTLVAILHRACKFSRMTEGAFDITVQPLWELYRAAAEKDQSPTDAERALAGKCVDYRNVTIDQVTIDHMVRLRNGARITLNGIAQGFATDRAKQVLQNSGIEHALIDFGELACLGEKATDTTWRAGIQHPRIEQAYTAIVPMDGRCLATSGDYHTRFRGDFASHHVFDPRTGLSPTELSSVSVLAPTALDADVLSTTCLVTGIRAGAQLLASFPNTDALFIRKDGSVVATEGFPTEVQG